MAKKHVVEKTFKMTKFVIYCYKDSKPGKEEGVVYMTDRRNKIVKENPEQHFDSYDEIGALVRQCMAEREP